MPTGAERLVDTSVAVPLLFESHEHHDHVFAALEGESVSLAGHAAFETYSVLTRLPPPDRLSPALVRVLMETNFGSTVFLTPEQSEAVAVALPTHGVAGGAVYDALVGAAAAYNRRELVTRDARAVGVYRQMGATVDLLG